jgi:hypothetical protein
VDEGPKRADQYDASCGMPIVFANSWEGSTHMIPLPTIGSKAPVSTRKFMALSDPVEFATNPAVCVSNCCRTSAFKLS